VVSGRSCTFESFMFLPRITELYLMSDKLRPVVWEVKRDTTRYCGVRICKHNIVRKYSDLHQLTWPGLLQVVERFSATLPLVIRHFPTGNPQAFQQG